MAYSTNPNLTKARKEALLAVISSGMPVCVAARRYGVHRVTLWRWVRKWKELNPQISYKNYNRPTRPYSWQHHLIGAVWNIPTQSSAPHSHPSRITSWIIERIVALREALGRCAAIIHHKLLMEGIRVSRSTVERIIAKHCTLKTKRRHIRRTLSRPDVAAPGDLVEMDTIHYVNKLTGERRYIFTVIDLFSRMSYAKCFDRIMPGGALLTLIEAERYFGFKIKVIQTDNGPEFSKWFSNQTHGKGIIHRHTRIHRPNDNAHIERFNRTLREECVGDHMRSDLTMEKINRRLMKYLDYYNEERLHLGLQFRVPRQMLQRW